MKQAYLGLRHGVSSLATCVLLLSCPAFAQGQAPDGAQRAKPASGLEEIVVTARKREENVQSTPIAISAFGASALAERGVQKASDITGYVPNVQFDSAASESGGGGSSQIAIRGSARPTTS
jgi:iron complex outermembrane receptor protein